LPQRVDTTFCLLGVTKPELTVGQCQKNLSECLAPN